jgi:hypothetical protein
LLNPIGQLIFGDIPDLVGRDFAEVVHLLFPAIISAQVLARQELEDSREALRRDDRRKNVYLRWPTNCAIRLRQLLIH